MRPHELAASRISEALKSLGFRVEDREVLASGHRFDLIASKGADRFAVEIKAHAPFRRKEFLGAVADGILQLRYLQRKRPSNAILAIWVDRASPNAASEFLAYIGKHAQDLNWLMMDSSGWLKWKIQGQEGESRQENLAEHSVSSARSGKSNPFAPSYQWLLKLLLLPGLDAKYWNGPNRQPSNISDLAVIGHVAQSSAWNLVALLEKKAYLKRDGRGFQFAGVRRLLEDWSAAVRLKPDDVFLAKSLYPVDSSEALVAGLVDRLPKRQMLDFNQDLPDFVIGGHFACHLLKLGRSNVSSLRLYVREERRSALERLELVPAEESSAHIEVVRPRAVQSVFQGSVLKGQVQVADALQCYLDLQGSPARGVEQSDFILERVLEPHFRRQGWL